jgi:DnaJ-class molecular chaperone
VNLTGYFFENGKAAPNPTISNGLATVEVQVKCEICGGKGWKIEDGKREECWACDGTGKELEAVDVYTVEGLSELNQKKATAKAKTKDRKVASKALIVSRVSFFYRDGRPAGEAKVGVNGLVCCPRPELRQEPCMDCRGSGRYEEWIDGGVRCRECEGTGVVPGSKPKVVIVEDRVYTSEDLARLNKNLDASRKRKERLAPAEPPASELPRTVSWLGRLFRRS